MGIPTVKISDNIGWKGDEPTEVVKNAVKEGIIKAGDKVLDIGSGFGRNANALAKIDADVTAVNINDDEIEQAKKRAEEAGVSVNYIHADATELPLPDKGFDVALDLGCSHMISSKEGQEKAAKEASRVIKPGGYLVYFGFSKEHPSYKNKPESPMFRSIEDVKDMYSNDFEIISQEETRWKPKPEENANFKEHVGINVVMKKK
jgi:ubiquinone/menaquinone biosynthesis C-methylase UbiE